MKTVNEWIRDGILVKLGMKGICLNELRSSQWSSQFESLMRNRLIFGSFRYGRLKAVGKPKYNRMKSIADRAKKYEEDGNDEHLVDIANLALCEFVEGSHPNKHFKAQDDSEHTEEI